MKRVYYLPFSFFNKAAVVTQLTASDMIRFGVAPENFFTATFSDTL